MRALLVRLSEMDANAESAVRVIATFDELISHRASAEALLRTAATLAGCAAGMSEVGREPLKYGPLGRRMVGERDAPSIERDLFLQGENVGRVWLERPGVAGDLDEIVIERMAIAAEAIIERTQRGTGIDRRLPPAIDVLLDPKASATERRHAARVLRLDPREPVRAVLVASSEGLGELATHVARMISGPAAAAWSMSGDSAVILTQGHDLEPDLARLTSDAAVAVGPQRSIDLVQESFDAATTALRFARSGGDVAWYDRLGARSLLVDIGVEQIRGNPDVIGLERLADGSGEPSDIDILDALCRMGSLRGAAAEVHLHHSSVAHRLRHIEDVLGYTLSTTDGLFRARLALDLWRISTEVTETAPESI